MINRFFSTNDPVASMSLPDAANSSSRRAAELVISTSPSLHVVEHSLHDREALYALTRQGRRRRAAQPCRDREHRFQSGPSSSVGRCRTPDLRIAHASLWFSA
jgi:hypothetical protein